MNAPRECDRGSNGSKRSTRALDEFIGLPVKSILQALICGYQLLLSPFFGRQCRFYPSCSHYAREAIEVHGPLKGSWLALRRILRCGPWHPGGPDPVPPKE